MALDTTAVISGRNFRVYSIPWDDANTIPDLQTAEYDDPGSPYTAGELGLTQGGLNFSMGLTRGEIRADQLFLPVVRPLQSANFQMVANLMEMRATNLNLATGMGDIDTTAPGATARGADDWVVNEDFGDQYNTYLFGVQQPDTMPFWVLGYRAIAVGSPNPSFTAEGAAVTQLTVAPLPDTSTDPARIMLIRDVLPPTG